MDDYGHHDDALTGSMIIGEIGTHTYFRLVVTGPARGQVWRDEVAANGDLIPGLDFADWYLNWLRRLGALKGSQTGRRRLV
ncbi:hypothetical protein ACTIVE_4776 [Actinomadura verrucosospora]|uniref:Uncharacterized protein n=1 Tax=Actinomadura verrucosospora TaxID=46165 RepID=A0A7D3VTX4_ACTVE|nr:hypothetical protein ACTIVE_4776 [Actinomadura verrucosospora]